MINTDTAELRIFSVDVIVWGIGLNGSERSIMIYLDNSATTRVLDCAANAALDCMRESYFNPASAYAPAAAMEKRIEGARARLASLLGADRSEIIYTSGGTESNNTAIFGVLRATRGKKRIITSAVEHPSVYEVFRTFEHAEDTEVVYVGVDAHGYLRLDALAEALTEDTALVSLMQVNNETGAINDLSAAQALIRKRAPHAVFHVDGVQGFCKLPFQKLSCDLYSVSGHKVHAPKGIGALYVKNSVRFAGGLIGGGQEQNRRSGTTNTPAIMGLDAALAAYQQNGDAWHEHMYACKERLCRNLSGIPDVFVNGPEPRNGAPHILNMSFLGVRGEVLLHALAQQEIYVSTGSACAAHKRGKNRVLGAMGVVGARQDGAIRFSLCPFNTLEEMDIAAEALAKQVTFLRRYQRR